MAPTTRDYIAADFIAWGENGIAAQDTTQLQTYIDRAASQDSSLKSWTPFAVSTKMSPTYTTTGLYTYATAGLYADAFLITDSITGSRQVVIAFQGSSWENQAQKNADLNILFNNTKQLEKAVEDFTEKVQKKAKDIGIPASQIFVTGHSLGGAEAQYAEKWSLSQGDSFGGGVTFGAPGIPGYVGSSYQIGNFVP